MAEKKELKKRVRLSRVWCVYAVVTAAAVLSVVIFLQVVKSRLAEYEDAQPKYVAEEVFDRYFRPIDYEKLLADARYDASGANESEIAEYLREEIGDSELTCSMGLSGAPGETRYLVKAGEKQLASIVLKVSDQKTAHGFDTYEFSYLTLHLNTDEPQPECLPVTVEAPASCLIAVDGAPISEEFFVSEYLKTDAMEFYPPEIAGVEYAVYVLEPQKDHTFEIAVTDAQGQPVEVNFDEASNTYTAGLPYSGELEEEYAEFVIEAMQGYSQYIQASASVSLGSIKPYFDTESEAYADVVAVGGDRWMVKEWSGVEFKDLTIGEFYAYTPEIFSCHISFTQVLHRDGREDYTDVVDKYVFLHRTENGYRIYAWHNG